MLKYVVFVSGSFHVPNILFGMVGLCFIQKQKIVYFVVDVLLLKIQCHLQLHKVKSHDGSKGQSDLNPIQAGLQLVNPSYLNIPW